MSKLRIVPAKRSGERARVEMLDGPMPLTPSRTFVQALGDGVADG